MATNNSIKFCRVDGIAYENLVAGAIYFDKDSGTIHIATSDTTTDKFGGDVSDAIWNETSSTLNIIKNDGTVISLNFSDMASASAVTSALNNKVDKVNGKQLSTEDFTTALKTKLEGLNNYDDATLSNALSTLRGDFDKLVSGDTTTAIKTFNEVIAFLDGLTDTQDLASIIASIEQQIAGKMDKVTLATVATSGSYNDLSNKPAIPVAVTESTVSGWGFTKNTGTYSKPSEGIPKSDLASAVQTSLGKADTALQSYTEQYKGTITGVSANGTSIATSGVANIPAASTSVYGVTKLSSSTSSTSTTLAATASAVKSAYDLANSYKGTVTGVKLNGATYSPTSGVVDLGTISGGSSDANVAAVDTGDVIDDVNVSYATTAYVDGLIGDINSVLESIISGGGSVQLITFTISSIEYQAEEGMTWGEWIDSAYNTNYNLHPSDNRYIVPPSSAVMAVYDGFNNRHIIISDIIRANYGYTLSALSIEPL